MLCEKCDREILNKLIQYLDKEPDLGIKIYRYTITNIGVDKVDEILNNYITIYNKDYDIYFNNCKFKIEFDDNLILIINTRYIHNVENEIINIILSFVIKNHELMG